MSIESGKLKTHIKLLLTSGSSHAYYFFLQTMKYDKSEVEEAQGETPGARS
jgi:hypothetical protein